jgi:hypothetical protein
MDLSKDNSLEVVNFKLLGESMKKRDWDEIISIASEREVHATKGKKINKLIDLQ